MLMDVCSLITSFSVNFDETISLGGLLTTKFLPLHSFIASLGGLLTTKFLPLHSFIVGLNIVGWNFFRLWLIFIAMN